MPPIEPNDLDQSIWRNELEDFVPSRVFDAHAHVYRPEFDLDRDDEDPRKPYHDITSSDLGTLQQIDRVILPGREVHYLAFGYPFPKCDFAALAEYTAATVSEDPQSAGLMVVAPSLDPAWVRETLAATGLIGMKPYRFYASTGDMVECRVTDMLPESLIQIADELGLIVTLHLGKGLAIGDPDNIADVKRLSAEYPRVTWILAHCARSFTPWPMEAAWEHIAGLTNVYIDTSAVCESDVFHIALRRLDRKRILYGSDNAPCGVERGKYVAFGRAWTFVGDRTEGLDLSHCDPRATFMCYESLRGLRRAADAQGLTRDEVEDIFWGNAAGLVERVRGAPVART